MGDLVKSLPEIIKSLDVIRTPLVLAGLALLVVAFVVWKISVGASDGLRKLIAVCVFLIALVTVTGGIGAFMMSSPCGALAPEYARLDLEGRDHLIKRQYLTAAEEFGRIIKKYPQYANAYKNRGVALYKLKDYRGALADFDRAIELAPNEPSALFNR